MSIKFLTSLFVKRRSPSRRAAEWAAWKIAFLQNKVAAVIQLNDAIHFDARPYDQEGYTDGHAVMVVPSGLQIMAGLLVIFGLVCIPCIIL